MSLRNLWERGELAISTAIASIFDPWPSGWGRRLVVVWYAALYVLGLGLWGYILDWGEIPFQLHDWAEGTGHRLAFLQNAVTQGMLPLHMPDGSALRNVTDRFIATPDTILSPQILLLRWLDLGDFVLFNTLLLYSVGFLGLVLLSRKLGLSAFSFSIAFFLFSFNGHITDHVIVGHMHWVGYFLLPFFVLLILDALESQPDWAWILKLALVLFLVFLQGAIHLFVMSLIFLALLAVSARHLIRPMVGAMAASVLLSLGRILPPALERGRFDTEFLSGFVSMDQLVTALIQIKSPIPSQVFGQSPLMSLGWWEVDHYVGVMGLAFLLVFGVWYWWRPGVSRERYGALAIPVFFMAFLSIGRVYKFVNLTGIPLVASQRVSTRFVIFSLIFLIVIAALNLQRLIDRTKPGSRKQLAYFAGLVLLAHDLWQHIKLWRIRRMYELFPEKPVDLTAEFVANRADPAYMLALGIGWGVGLVALCVLIYLSSKNKGSIID